MHATGGVGLLEGGAQSEMYPDAQLFGWAFEGTGLTDA